MLVKCLRRLPVLALTLLLLVSLSGWSVCGEESARAKHRPRRHQVEIRGFAYRPAELQVTAGDTIVWINRDIVPHNAAAGKAWDTGKIEANASGLVVARGKGEQTYSCTYHPNMQAKLVVR